MRFTLKHLPVYGTNYANVIWQWTKSVSPWPICIKQHNWGLPWAHIQYGHKGPVLRTRCIETGRVRIQIPFNSIQFNVYDMNKFKAEDTLTIYLHLLPRLRWDGTLPHLHKTSWHHYELITETNYNNSLYDMESRQAN